MTPRVVVRRIKALDPTAHIAHQDGSHQKWRLWNRTSIIVPIHSRDIPIGTLRSVERQGTSALGAGWLLGSRER